MKKISATAIEQYERCPRRYHEERIEKKRGQPPDSFRLGRVCHRVIQRLMTKHREDGQVKPFDASLANDFYQEEWAKESGLSGEDLFTEGLTMIVRFVEKWSPMDPGRILGIEEGFEISIVPGTEEFWPGDDDDPRDGEGDPETAARAPESETLNTATAFGFMDLVLAEETVDESTGEVFRKIDVIDYKSSHAFVTTRDAEASVQLALYNLAARQKWPGAERYTCTLHMLQDGTNVTVRHEPGQLAGFKKYILATVQQIENDTTWIPKLAPDCVWCHLRAECPAYQKAAKTHNYVATETMDDLEQLAKEREQVAISAKIFTKRKEEIDAVLKEHISRMQGPLLLGGYVFSVSRVDSLEHDPRTVIELLSEKLGLQTGDIVAATMEVQKKRLDQLLTQQAETHGLTKVGLVQAALVNRADHKISSRMNPPKKEKDTHKGKKKE